MSQRIPADRSDHQGPARRSTTAPGRGGMLAAIVLLAIGSLLGGCEIPATIVYKVAGPLPVPAKYKPPMQPMLVLIENYANPAVTQMDAEPVAMRLIEQLREHAVAPMVGMEELSNVRRTRGESYRSMKVYEIGQAVGAKQVLYVELIECDVMIESGGELMRGTGRARVRMVDVAGGVTSWPDGASAGEPVEVRTPLLQARNGADEPLLRAMIHASLADRIAKLFYSWQPEYESQ